MAYSDKQKEDIFKYIFGEVSKGRAVRNVLKDDDMPSVPTFYDWLDNDEEKSKQYARACEIRADAIFDEIIDIADDKTLDITYTESGVQIANTEFIARSRVRIDARKWVASKLQPKKYGDKVDVTTNGDNVNTILPFFGNNPLDD